ncbi:ABC transporter permease [uncultured Clostridium sp.]|uniref:ABC transporter permease n=1 Tax=uncultured Clostridium sp. TaxID=59620 RepID=UPI002638C492|nr:ABC transporter permease [uncultured Clostridium sp.]
MNFLGRAFLSTKENKGKTILLFLVMTTICVFILSGISIQQATTQASNFAREKLGATVTLQANMQKMREDMMKEGNGSKFQVKSVSIPMSDVDKILKLNNISSYNLTTTTSGIAQGFNPITSSESSTNTQQNNFPFKGNEQQQQGNIKINGVLDQGLLQDAKNGTIKLVEGEGITKENGNQNVAVISEALANNNDLKVGDTIKIQSPTTDDVYSVKIQGIYETSGEVNEMEARNEAMNPYNAIYVPYTLANTMKGSDYKDTVDQATFYLNDPLNVDSFVKEAEKLDIDYNTFMLNANNKEYETMIGPINNVSSFAKITVVGASVAGAIILALIIILTIKNRRNEIDILLSLGEKKGKIIAQFTAEMLIVLVIALGVSAGVGSVVSNKLGNTLVQKEVAVTAQSQEQSGFGGFNGGGFNSGGFRGGLGPGSNHEQVQAISSINVSVSGEDFAEMAGIAILIMIIGIGIPSVGIMRLQPKEILSRHD